MVHALSLSVLLENGNDFEIQNKETIVGDEECKSVSTNANFNSNFFLATNKVLNIILK